MIPERIIYILKGKAGALLIIFLFALLQLTLLNNLRLFYIQPDLLFIFMIGISFSFELGWVLFLSILTGSLKDLFTASAFALNTLLFPLISFLIFRLSREMVIENVVMRALIASLALILLDIAARLINMLAGNFLSLGIFLRIMGLESLYTGLAAYFIFRWLSKIE